MINILIVSSDPLRASAISMALQGQNLDIHHLGSRECLVEYCRINDVQLIIFLSLSPYFASMNVVEQLSRQLVQLPKIYVVAHSQSSSTILALLECGVDQYMTFPLNLYRLRSKVYSLFNVN
ncbi:MAG: hypothetical protein R3Y44_03600 [Rikenellaceae bacterium]